MMTVTPKDCAVIVALGAIVFGWGVSWKGLSDKVAACATREELSEITHQIDLKILELKLTTGG